MHTSIKQTFLSLTLILTASLLSKNSTAQYIVHVAGNGISGNSGDSAFAWEASLRCPTTVCIDSAGGLYIADGGPIGYRNDGRVRRVDPVTGVISTIAGMVGAADSAWNTADNILATNAKLNGCSSVCMYKKSNILVADGVSSVRSIDLNTGIISTIAGNRNPDAIGYSGDGGMATDARLDGPCDIAVDGADNIYIADLHNHCIRKVNALSGVITTVAGRSAKGYSGDNGPAALAKLNQPRGIFVDGANDLFIADYNNNRIRKVSAATGIITTVAGNGSPGFSGDDSLAVNAQLAQPARVTKDQSGNLYIADVANQRIRKVDALTGIISTYAGNGKYFNGPDDDGDGGAAIDASIVPYGMCFDDCGNMYLGGVVCRIRAITQVIPSANILCGKIFVSVSDLNTVSHQNLKVYPNPSQGRFTFHLPASGNKPVEILISDVTGRIVKEMTTGTNIDTQIQLDAPKGLYFITASSGHGKWTRKIVVE